MGRNRHSSRTKCRRIQDALEVLPGFYQSTGKPISLHGAAVQFTEAAGKLNSRRSPVEALDRFLESVVSVKRISLREAIDQFLAFRKGKTLAPEGRLRARFFVSPARDWG